MVAYMPHTTTCAVEECPKPVLARGWCSTHYHRWRYRATDKPTCAVDECERRATHREWCLMHYKRWWRHGSTELPEVEPEVCSVDECERRATHREWCLMHYKRVRKHGAPVTVKSNVPTTYSSAHQRVTRTKGKASEYECVCGDQAAEWAYDHNDPDESYGTGRDKGKPYSLNPDHYQPMCISCHRSFDATRPGKG